MPDEPFWKHACCDDMAAACEDGTDSEMYGPAIYKPDELRSEWRVGGVLKPMLFCPWCGSPLSR